MKQLMLLLNVSLKELLLLNKLSVVVLDSIFNLLIFKNRMGYNTLKSFLLVLTSGLETQNSISKCGDIHTLKGPCYGSGSQSMASNHECLVLI